MPIWLGPFASCFPSSLATSLHPSIASSSTPPDWSGTAQVSWCSEVRGWESQPSPWPASGQGGG
jgi:hypothetical protein